MKRLASITLAAMVLTGCDELTRPDAETLLQQPRYAVSSATAGTAILAYVANGSSNTVSVINTTADPPTVVATVPVGIFPLAVAITPDGARAYVTVVGANAVSVINTTADPPTVEATVPVGCCPFGVAITRDGARAYVTDQNENTVSVINTADPPTVEATVFVGGLVQMTGGPVDVAITPFQ